MVSGREIDASVIGDRELRDTLPTGRRWASPSSRVPFTSCANAAGKVGQFTGFDKVMQYDGVHG